MSTPVVKPYRSKEVGQPRCVIVGDKVPSDWFDGQEGRTVEEWGQREYDSGKTAGLEQGRLQAFTYLIERATELFKSGKDIEAMTLRAHADAIKALK